MRAAPVLVASLLASAPVHAQPVEPPIAPPIAPPMAPPVPAPLTDGLAEVVARVRPAVVGVRARKVMKGLRDGSSFFAPHGGERRVRGQGAGVIVSADGYILTNNHVVEDAEAVRVTLDDGRELRAKVVGTDPPSEIALIKVDAQGLPTLSFGDSTRVRPGDLALAVGSPYGLSASVTMGIISAVGRGDIGLVDYEDFLQTDAAINPGNSGGALVNTAGELIGINTAVVTGGGQGIGFAVPVHMARAVMDQIRAHGRVIRGWLGIAIQEVTPGVAKALGLPEARGALVGDVTADGPAARAGLRRGEVIVELDGTPVDSSRTLRMRIAGAAPGTKVRLGLLRDGQRRTVTATLGELPLRKEPPRQQRQGAPVQREPERLGMSLASLDAALREELAIPADLRTAKAVVVIQVEEGSRAGEAGLRTGDVIVEIDGTRLTDDDARAALHRLERARPALLLIVRAGTTMYVLLDGD